MARMDEERDALFERFINTCVRWNNSMKITKENRNDLPGAFIEGIFYGRLEVINELVYDIEDVDAMDLLHVLIEEAMRVIALCKRIDIEWIKHRYETWKEINGIA